MPTISQTFRHLRRYRQIARILTRYGFGHILTQLGIGRMIAPGLQKLRFSSAEILRATPAERVRMAVEELGPTFIKLGQILSTRADIIPPDLINELEKLQDTVPPTPFPLIQAQVELELERSLEELFAAFDPVPVASASLGQVHLATLAGGEEVAVKVFRPGIDKVIDVDLDILLQAAALAQKRTDWGQYYDVLSLAHEFANTLRQEQNYEQEGHNMDRFRQIFAGEPSVRVPSVYWDTTTRRVLTMERLGGVKITDLEGLERAGLDPAVIARRNIHILLKAVLQEGFFHADPHAGNFAVLPGEVIGMMDFGIMGQVDPGARLGLIQLFVGLFRGDAQRSVEALSSLGIATRAADKRVLTRDMDRLRLQYYGLELRKIRARTFVEDLMGIAFANHLRMPSNLVLVFKTIAMLEGISLMLDPDINVFQEVEPYVRDALLELESPFSRVKRLSEQLRESTEATLLLPKQIHALFEQMEDGEAGLSFRLRGLEELTGRLTSAANRLALAILAAAFVVGPALIIPYLKQLWPSWQSPALTLILGGFSLSLLITMILLLSIWRAGRQGRR
ncbi:MAG: AarF/ABC1/UbiB kinase family protein [Anaerolineae bacterium]|nr:AarF/ABC1/UbiB kinase family protein [Anaerolineae bacterium]